MLVLCAVLGHPKADAQTVQIGTGTDVPPNTLYGPIYRYTSTSTTTAARCDMLWTQAEMVAAGIPSGATITAIEFNKTNVANFVTPATYSIYMGNTSNTALATTQTWAAITGSFTQVFTSASYNIPSAAGWVNMPVTPFTYTGGALEIATELQMAGNGGATDNFEWQYTSSVAADKIVGVSSLAAALNGTVAAYKRRPNIKITFISGPCTSPPTPGTANASPATVCTGGSVSISLTGNSVGSGQTYQWQSSPTATGTYTNVGTSSSSFTQTINPTASLYYRVAVTCGTSTAYSAPVLVTVNSGLTGTFTINSANPTAGTNFQTFADAVSALGCGVSGPVVFNVAAGSGPYTEQVVIPAITGTSAVNTITFNGNGAELRATPVSANRAMITLDDADYTIFDSLKLVSLSATYGWGVHLTNGADNNTIRRCTIDMTAVTSTTEANSGGIIGSGSATSVTTAGSASFNTITRNRISGAYTGIMLRGGTGSINAVKNIIASNIIQDVYANGIELFYADSTVVDANDISRPARTTSTTFAGITLNTGSIKCRINANKIHDTHNMTTTQTGTAYGIYLTAADATTGAENRVTNNLIYNFNSGSGPQYGLYNSSSDGVFYYHNTIVLSNATSTAGITRGFYQTTAATNVVLKDNIFYITRGGTGEKQCVMFNTTTSTITSDKNDLYINAPAGTNYVGSFGTTGYATLAAWRTANGGIYDQQSDTLDPVFTAIATGNFLPTSTALDNRGTPVGVTNDITGAARSATVPDMGAYEFGVPSCAQPTGLAATGITATAATLNWNGPTGITGYEYVLNQSATAPTGSGTPTTATTYTAGPLTPLTTYYMHVRTNCGAGFSSWVTISFTTLCTPPAATITPAGPVTICTGNNIVLKANTGTGLTYQWKNGTANIPGATDSMYTVTASGSYSVVVSLSTCNTTAAAVVVTTVSRPDTVLTMNPASGSVCTGNSVALNVPSATGVTYQWFRNNIAIAGAAGNSYTATTSGSYRVLVSNGSCADTSAAGTVTILPAVAATITPAGPTTFCQGNNVVLNGNTPSTGLTYQWLLNGAAIPAATGGTYTATTAGNYRLIVSNGACSDTSSTVSVTVNPTPVATVTPSGPTAFCTGNSVVLNAPTGTSITYVWLRNTAPIVPAATGASYTVTQSGVYAVVVRNTATGCSDTSDPGTPVAVSAPPPSTLNVTGSLSFCQGGSVTLTAPVGTGYTYVWYKDIGIIPGATTSSYIATQAGAYYVIVSNGSCSTTSVTRTVVVNPLPVAVITPAGATSFCSPGSVALNANTGTGLTYQWQLNTFNIPGATSSSYTATASGNYTVIVANGNCTTTSAIISVNASTMPSPVITPSGPTDFCQGGDVTLQTAPDPAYTYQWQLNTVNIPGANTDIYVATAAGDYTVVVTNGSCVATSAILTATVRPTPPANVLPDGPTTFCDGGAVTLHGDIAAGYTYQWMNGGVNIPAAVGQAYIATASGDYSVLISDGQCATTSTEVVITVNPVPAMPVISLNNDVLSTTVPYTTYQWYKDGTLIPGATSRDYTATQNGIYTVVAGNAYGCEATSDALTVTVSSVDVPQVNNNKSIRIWPNPVGNTLHIDTKVPVNISISTVDGKEAMRQDKVTTVDVTPLPQGFYMIRVTDASTGTLMSIQKITKQ